MMMHNLVKYVVQTRLRLLLFLYLTNEVEFRQNIYKIVYHHIIYMCDFLVNLDDFFVVVCTGFHEVVVCTRYVSE